MTPETKQKVQLFLVLAIAMVAIRAAYIFYDRWAGQREAIKTEVPLLSADYYVTPKKLYPYDLKSAKQLTQQPVWVKEGYRYICYSYDLSRHRADFAHPAGQLLPLEKLEIKDVVTDITPGAPDQRQVMAVYAKEGKSYAFPIGVLKDGDYQIYSDEMLYIQDPHELYRHWPAEIWDAIDKHEMKLGMNELQADCAVGMGTLEGGGPPGDRTLHYPNGGKPLIVTYRNGKAAEIKPGG